MWVLTIPGPLPRMNKLFGAHWRTTSNQRKKWRTLIAAHAKMAGVTAAAGHRRLVIKRYYTGHGKELDKDNLSGGCKIVVDAFVKCGALVDDAPKWCTVDYEQHRIKGTTHTVFELYDGADAWRIARAPEWRRPDGIASGVAMRMQGELSLTAAGKLQKAWEEANPNSLATCPHCGQVMP